MTTSVPQVPPLFGVLGDVAGAESSVDALLMATRRRYCPEPGEAEHATPYRHHAYCNTARLLAQDQRHLAKACAKSTQRLHRCPAAHPSVHTYSCQRDKENDR